MSEEQLEQQNDEVIEVAEPSAEELKEARLLGWSPKEQWRGNPDEWLDAKSFLDRGKSVLPILKSNNQRLQSELSARDAQLAEQAAALRAANAAIKALEESNTANVQQQAQATIEEIEQQIEEASRDGDHRAVAKLTTKLVDVKTALKEAGTEKSGNGKDTELSGGMRMPPELVTWMNSNPDMQQPRRIALANAIADEKRKAGDRRIGPVFLDEVAAEVRQILDGAPAAGTNKVASGGGGMGRSSGGGSAGNGKAYDDLPADAKAACEKMAGKFVGEGKKFKDAASWRKAYTKSYFEQE